MKKYLSKTISFLREWPITFGWVRSLLGCDFIATILFRLENISLKKKLVMIQAPNI
jgi:hypothetical protein